MDRKKKKTAAGGSHQTSHHAREVCKEAGKNVRRSWRRREAVAKRPNISKMRQQPKRKRKIVREMDNSQTEGGREFVDRPWGTGRGYDGRGGGKAK